MPQRREKRKKERWGNGCRLPCAAHYMIVQHPPPALDCCHALFSAPARNGSCCDSTNAMMLFKTVHQPHPCAVSQGSVSSDQLLGNGLFNEFSRAVPLADRKSVV